MFKLLIFIIKFSIGIWLIWSISVFLLNTPFVSNLTFIQTMKKDSEVSIQHFNEKTKPQIIKVALEAIDFDYKKDYVGVKNK